MASQNVCCFLRPKSLKENVGCDMEEGVLLKVTFTGQTYRLDTEHRFID